MLRFSNTALFSVQNLFNKKNWHQKACLDRPLFAQVSWACVICVKKW